MVEGDEAAFEVLVAHQQLAEAIEPVMADLNPQRLAFFVGSRLLASYSRRRSTT